MYEGFIEKNSIDENDLLSFKIEELDEYEEQMERYHFDEFDDMYYELDEKESLNDMLMRYVKLHLEDFSI